MKILSAPQGDGPLTNVEVLQWLREKNFDNTKRNNDQGATINPPVVVANIAHQVRKYIETSPAGLFPSLFQFSAPLNPMRYLTPLYYSLILFA